MICTSLCLLRTFSSSSGSLSHPSLLPFPFTLSRKSSPRHQLSLARIQYHLCRPWLASAFASVYFLEVTLIFNDAGVVFNPSASARDCLLSVSSTLASASVS